MSCGDDAPAYRSRAELLDPATCKECHAKHYDEWSASMHAYASRDPVFLAMNRRGQEETGGALGSFCVNCHAPMAVREGATVDGLNLADVPDHLQGVGCYFCHNVSAVEETHNNGLRLADDVTMRGRIRRSRGQPGPPFGGVVVAVRRGGRQREDVRRVPRPGAAGAAGVGRGRARANVPGVERRRLRARAGADAVGGGDVQLLPHAAEHRPGADRGGARAERAQPDPAPASVRGRRRGPDRLPGSAAIRRATWSSRADQRTQIQQLLDITLRIDICVQQVGSGSAVYVTLDNANAGHNWPSGASQDRRAFVEVIAYSAGGRIYQSGVIADGETVTASADPDLWLFRDRMFDAAGGETHMFWEAARAEPGTIGAQVTSDPADPRFYTASHAVRRFPASRSATIPGLPIA